MVKIRQSKQIDFVSWLHWYFFEEVAENVLDDDLLDETNKWIDILTEEEKTNLAKMYGIDMMNVFFNNR